MDLSKRIYWRTKDTMARSSVTNLIFTAGVLTVLLCSSATYSAQGNNSLWGHLKDASELVCVRGFSGCFEGKGSVRKLKLKVNEVIEPHKLTWVAVAPPDTGWKLGRAKTVEATIRNTGPSEAEVMLWVVGANGWAAVGDSAKLESNQKATLICNLRETYPKGSSKINPNNIKHIRVMMKGVGLESSLEVTDLVSSGEAQEWKRPLGRLDIPEIVMGKPAPGKRVRYQLEKDRGTDIYCLLYLPTDWQSSKFYPVIAEFPGNIFFKPKVCWSTGLPEQCGMGYGITKGKGAIWISLPFVDRIAGKNAENGFGSSAGEDTVKYTIEIMAEICEKWGGEKSNLFLSGFSRGAIACGYIGLWDDKIASLWKGFVACQHYDGSRWNQSKMSDAVIRAGRFKGRSIFQVDNEPEKYQLLVAATDPSVEWVWVKSGLHFHSTAMFLDDRDSAIQLRQWFLELAKK